MQSDFQIQTVQHTSSLLMERINNSISIKQEAISQLKTLLKDKSPEIEPLRLTYQSMIEALSITILELQSYYEELQKIQNQETALALSSAGQVVH